MILKELSIRKGFLVLSSLMFVNTHAQESEHFPLNSTGKLNLYNVTATSTTYLDRKSVKIEALINEKEFKIAVLKTNTFSNGTIEVDVVGKIGKNAPQGSRGFVGVAFRIPEDTSKFECFYIRPTNGRAEDQLRRNHSTQYISFPDYPWYRLREENPGVYESYTDLAPGEWTKLKIEVLGSVARLFVNGSSQPVLIVTDLKHGENAAGNIGLWIGSGTEAYFSNLKITRE